MEAHAFQATIRVMGAELQKQQALARQLLQQARYKQALRALDEMLQSPATLVDRLQVLAEHALAQALWKKPEAAIDDADQILATVQADTDQLSAAEIDWDYEKTQDIGHLAFLADIYQLRGVLYELRQSSRRAVEDLTLSIYMTVDEPNNLLNYLQRATALIALEDCLEKACDDLNLAWQINAETVRNWLQLPESGHFELEQRVVFVHPEGRITLTPDKVRLRMNRLGPHWFRLAQRIGL